MTTTTGLSSIKQCSPATSTTTFKNALTNYMTSSFAGKGLFVQGGGCHHSFHPLNSDITN